MKILGLDLGTNSIGWAVVNADETTRKDNTAHPDFSVAGPHRPCMTA